MSTFTTGTSAGTMARSLAAKRCSGRTGLPTAAPTMPKRRGAAVVAPRAFLNDISRVIKRELELTFNPRTRGAKIAGRCPDTQTLPSEMENKNGADAYTAFDPRAFAAQLEEQLADDTVEDSFSQAQSDKELNAELVRRLAQVNDAQMDEEEAKAQVAIMAAEDDADYIYWEESQNSEGPLTGRELALLCYSKYGKYHDMAVKHVRMGKGMKRWVSLNLYVGHLGQRSYPATEETYLEQLDAIAYMITSWGQADYARGFFRQRPVARRGLPSHPRVDTCVTLQFNTSPTWSDELGDEFFSY